MQDELFHHGCKRISTEPRAAGEIKFLHNYQKALGLERSYFSALELLIPNFDPEIIRGTDYYTFVLEALEVVS